MAYNTLADELLYGGSAGGGKTDLLIGLSGTRHRRSIIFRRVFPNMRGLIDRSREIFFDDDYNESSHIWRRRDGRVIELGSMPGEKDKRNYQGRPHDLKGWDELTEFTESQFRFTNAWNRTTVLGQRCRVVATSNPPTSAEGQWVITYWAPWLSDQHPNPAKAGELRWFASIDGKDKEMESGEPFTYKGDTLKPKSRTFIPARLTDNPYLMNTDYGTVLQNLPEPLRSQLLLGDWKAGVKDDIWQVIPTAWVDAAIRRGREQGKPNIPLTQLGVDVARGGADQTVLARRFGHWLAPLERHPGSETPNGPVVAALVMKAVHADTRVCIDVVGVGASVYDVLNGQGLHVQGINFGAGSDAVDASGKLHFANLRAEYYWKFREALDPDYGEPVALPDDPELKADLTAPRWSLSKSGILIEDKDDIRARLGRSPDSGDAVVMAWRSPQLQIWI